MSESLVFFLLGVAVAIPINIGTNIFTPTLQRIWGERSAQATAERKLQVEADFQLVKRYHNDATQYHGYLLATIIRLTFISAVTSLAGGLLLSLSYFSTAIPYYILRIPYTLSNLLIAAGLVAGVLGTLVVINTASRALRVVTRVQRFPEFEAKVAEILGDDWPRISGH